MRPAATGAIIALGLAAEGAAVAVNYRGSAEEAEGVVAEIKAAGGNVRAYQADMSDLEAVRGMIASIVSDFGGLNILVNNAGMAIRNRFLDTTPDEWRRQIDANLYGAIDLCHEAAPGISPLHGRRRPPLPRECPELRGRARRTRPAPVPWPGTAPL